MLVTKLCMILCDPMDCTPPGSSVHGVLQARVLEWAAIPFSRDLPNPGIKPRSPALQADSLPPEPPGKPNYVNTYENKQKLLPALMWDSKVFFCFCFFFFPFFNLPGLSAYLSPCLTISSIHQPINLSTVSPEHLQLF